MAAAPPMSREEVLADLKRRLEEAGLELKGEPSVTVSQEAGPVWLYEVAFHDDDGKNRR